MNTQQIQVDFDTLENILERRSLLEKTKQELFQKIESIKRQENNINKKIWNMCNHDWVIDRSCSDDDLCKRYCSVCNLVNLKSLYN